ncbi:MAG: glycine betaine ABC transporter substrate-binding protein [Bacteroidales bacterium]|nr:glycine betaine ABC transporter substrate-binding protein [Bacteroidales bacterium]MBS3774708.1 glycine betaine ABC transporter substrate-binding protein [Bacteroidales bacterium]
MKKFEFSLKTVFAVLMAAAVLSFSSCQQGGQQESAREEGAANKSEQVHILYPNWAEGIAFTHLAKAALEEKGYDIKITPLEPGPIYATLAKGDADLMLDAWLPHTHSDYWEKYGDQMNKIGESFSGGTTGLVVPQYVDFNSITELNDHVDTFDGEIIGIGSGAGIHGNTEKAIEEYDLDYNQITSSGPAMMASLRKAYNNQDPIIITGWKPHHMWADFDLKYLEDPKEIYPKDVCAIVTRQGFEGDFPVLQKFFTNFNLNETQLYNLMDAIEKGEDELEAADQWYNDHKVLVESWMPDELKQ